MGGGKVTRTQDLLAGHRTIGWWTHGKVREYRMWTPAGEVIVPPGQLPPPILVRTVVRVGVSGLYNTLFYVSFDTGSDQVWGPHVEVDTLNVVLPEVNWAAITKAAGTAPPVQVHTLDDNVAMAEKLYTARSPDLARYPHKCIKCGRAAYLGAGVRALHAPDDREACK